MPAALLTVAPSRRHQTAPACDVINVRQGRGEACARPGMVRGGPAPPWSRNDRRYRWRTPPSCPRAPCRTGTASGSATSTPRSPSERPGGRAAGRATEWLCGPGAALPAAPPRVPPRSRAARNSRYRRPPSQHPFPFSWAALCALLVLARPRLLSQPRPGCGCAVAPGRAPHSAGGPGARNGSVCPPGVGVEPCMCPVP